MEHSASSQQQVKSTRDDFTEKQFGEVGRLDVVIEDDRGDAGHERQTSGHVEVKMERLAEPANNRQQSRTQPADTAQRHRSMV